MIQTYLFIAVLLLAAELIYFRIADKCNIIDKPNERSSHSTIVLRGGGVIIFNHRNPSKYNLEEHDMLNWLKANRKKMNAGLLQEPRLLR